MAETRGRSNGKDLITMYVYYYKLVLTVISYDKNIKILKL